MIIIGGGASGLMCASFLEGKRGLLLEKRESLASKVLISGGGKCNVTNEKMDPSFFRGDSSFIQKVLEQFSHTDLLSWLSAEGLDLVKRPNGCYFCPLKASQMGEVLIHHAQKRVTIIKNAPLISSSRGEDGFYTIETPQGVFKGKAVVIATGGLSYPLLGGGDKGMEVAKKLGHEIVTPTPALVGWTLQKEQFWMKELSGISLGVTLTIREKKIRGDWLFAHKGVSGPAVLNGSLYWDKGSVEVDFLPETSIEACVTKGGNKFVSGIFGLPKRFMEAFLGSLGLKDAPYKSYTQEEKNLLQRLKCYSFSPAGNFGYTKAEVTRGGVGVSHIDPSTMESKLHQGLYVIGEVLDVTGEVGGYNLQWAFSSAVVAARAISKE